LIVGDRIVAVQVPNVAGRDADFGQIDVGAFDEVAIRLLQKPDARAALFKLARRPLVDRDIVPRIVQQAPGGQTAERPANDRNSQWGARRWCCGQRT